MNVLGVICSKGPFTENDRTADESFWNSQARSLGFTLEQVETAINDWTNSVTDPYQAGLAALYRNDYHLASKYISSSLDSDMEPNTDVSAVPHAERFVLLARAEFEQANYDAAESALRTFLHIHPNDELVQKNLDLVQADEKEEEKLFDLSGNWTGFTEGDKQKYPLKIHIDKEESRSSIRKRTAFSALVNGIQCRGDLDKRWWDKRWWDIERLREVPVTLTCGNLGYDFEGVIKDSGTDRVMTGTVSRGNQPKLRFYVERER